MRFFICCLLLFPFWVNAQNAPCSDLAYSQMDFWLGEWDVFDVKGKKVGENRIERMLDGCMLMENWEGASGSKGHSMNAYNSAKKQWEQFWVDQSGGVIHFTGAWNPGTESMELETLLPAPDGTPLRQRLVFTPLPNGDVHQVWTMYPRASEEPKVLFDGRYKRKETDSGK